eukprot:5094471-Prymnesium_polylepis.1
MPDRERVGSERMGCRSTLAPRCPPRVRFSLRLLGSRCGIHNSQFHIPGFSESGDECDTILFSK